jgi:hypothetical protein
MKKINDFTAILILTAIAMLPTAALLTMSCDAEAANAATAPFLHTLQRHKSDFEENDIERRERLQAIGDEIDKVTEFKWERRLLVAIAWGESRLASGVQDCSILGDQGKAKGLFQSHVWKDDKEKCPTLQEQVAEVKRHMWAAMRYCKGKTLDDRIYRGLALYATGNSCSYSGSRVRLKIYHGMMAKP